MAACSYNLQELIEKAAEHASNWGKDGKVLWQAEIETNQ